LDDNNLFMKQNFVKWSGMLAWLAWSGFAVNVGSAQETNEVEQLRNELREMRQHVQALEDRLGLAAPSGTAAASVETCATSPTDPQTSWLRDLTQSAPGGSYAQVGMVATFAAGGSTARDIEGGTQLGGHDPNQRGFTVQGAELNLQGAVDPYFRGTANILFAVDSEGESYLELEEAWLETVALPGNFLIRAGQILSDFGRINTFHTHAWGFVDSPLVNARLLGPDGLRNPGARLSWLAPTPFYSELMLGVQNSHGETATSFRSSGHSHGHDDDEEEIPFGYRHADNDRGVRGLGDLLFTPRYAMSFDLTDAQTVLLGVSGAFGPNSSGGEGDTMTQIYGVDFYWKWKAADAHGGFPFVSFQTEAMLRRYELGAFDWDEDGDGLLSDRELEDTTTGLPAVLGAETVTDYGFYSELLYGFRKGWVAGVRYDYVGNRKADYEQLALALDGDLLGRDPLRAQRWRVSPNLTWYPTEFSKIRLQYNYDDRRQLGEDHSVWLQFEFLLGSHAAHKF
jgi:hypothetical protein